ncbi:flagellar hook assembly protein FlgD [Planctomicrobium piriforme]|uniref:Basal-body rod modification protein FlgD n=1 Tax=Planctomicrobium piriforme TaxID=1576369 RepID=A0A1I3HMJ0_9PLAN|nr:flagellar basal-body rod modification protein FlgD [Planctomicrobium piriforme]
MASVASGGFSSQIGQQQFLQLLAAQLSNQNPLEPMAQEDFLSQMAQFSTLSGIESLNTNFSELFKLQSLTQGAALVGKQVTYYSETTKANQTGIVQSAGMENGSLVVTVNGEKVGLDDISSVGGTPDASN